MTNKQYAYNLVGKFGLSDNEVEFILFESDIDPDLVISTTDDRLAVKKAIFYQIPAMISGLSNVTEGGYTVSWNIDGIKSWYSFLASELGFDDNLNEKSVIRDKSNRW